MLVKVCLCRSRCIKNKMSRKENYEGVQVQEVRKMFELSSKCWRSSGKKASFPSPFAVRYTTTSFRHSCIIAWWLLDMVMTMMIMVMLLVTPCSSLEPRCLPSDGSNSYCECNIMEIRSGMQINIRCDFQMKEDVLLTEKLYPFRESKALRASVLLTNATSVKVTQAFLGEWLHVLSVGLDLWNCGTVSLTSAPFINLQFPHSFSTFIGIGLVGCEVPEIPTDLLRDRITASLRIKHCVVGTVRQGVINSVRKVGYIVLEDSTVEKVEGTLAMNGYFDLSSLKEDSWNGLILRNVTMRLLGPGSFNVTHKAKIRENTHKVEVKGCRVDKMGEGGITALGDIAVTIKDNSFGNLADEAFKQVFRVINLDMAVTSTVFSTSTWVLLVLLLLLVMVAGSFLYQWRESNKLVNLNQESFHSYNGISSSARYQANQQEVSMMQDGVSNLLYNRTSL